MYDLIIRNATIVTAHVSQAADLAIRDGKVAAIGRDLTSARESIDATGLTLLPGIVDEHVHFREPGLTEKEDFASGTLAAAAGGVTTIFDMPNTKPPTSTVEHFREKCRLAEASARVDVGLFGIILGGQESNEFELAGLIEEGAIGLKLFLGETTGNNPCPDDGAIFGAFQIAARCGSVVAVHAENDPILQRLKRETRATGRTDARAHLVARPPFIESEAIGRAVAIAAEAGNRLHVVHVSSKQGLAVVREAKRRRLPVTAEALISHLLLDDTVYERFGNLAVQNPPIREAEHVGALWEGLADGTIDTIATDHAAHTASEQATTDVWRAAGGFIGVETLLPLLLTQVAGGRLTLSDVVRFASERPARIFGVYPRKGCLAIGSDADLTLVDLSQRYTFDQLSLHSKHPVSPFHGTRMQGRVVSTYVRGSCVFRDGKAEGTARGRVIRPDR